MIAAGIAEALLAPKSIALVGASADENKHASLPQRYLRRHGYGGEIFPVNARREQVFGERAYPSVSAIGRPVEHAFIMLPTEAVTEAVSDCCRAGVACATILSNGFAESGPAGRDRQEALLARAREGGLRLLGPNSLGVINLQDKVALSANEILSLPKLLPGRFGLVSQSGSMIGGLLSRGQARGLGFSKLVSVGNEADLGVAEVGEMLLADSGTDALLLFLETIRNADAFAAMARRAFDAGKPVIAFRVGRSALGEKLAASHTGALTANGPALDAFLRDLGVVRVDTLDALIEAAPLLIGAKPPKGRRVSVMTTTGGGGALVVDGLAAQDIEIAPPSDESVARLARSGIGIAKAPLIDLTLTGTNPRTYGAVLAELLASEANDLVVCVVGSSSQFRPDRAVTPIREALAAGSAKPLAAFLTPQADASLALLAEAGVAAFRTPEACADAVRAYFDWRAPRVLPPPDERPALDLPEGTLDAVAAAHVFAQLGVTMAEDIVLPPDAAEVAAAELGGLRYPVIAKILSPDIPHKTEVGGVIANLAGPGEVRAAARRILEQVAARMPEARLDGVQIQAMHRGLAEALVGYRRDPAVGPIVTLGVGGVLAEIYRDVSVRLAPVDEATAVEMIAEVRGLAPIRGYRNLPRGDLAALARTIAAVSRLAFEPRVGEAELNPLLVQAEGEGAIAVDAVILMQGGAR